MKVNSSAKFCFCLPLRNALLVVGCIKLLSSILAVIYSFDITSFSDNLLVMMPLTDSFFNGIFVVAVYKENLKLYRWYFFYGVVIMTLMIMSVPIVFIGRQNESLITSFCETLVLPYGAYFNGSLAITLGVVIISMLFQTYILLLVLSKVRALQEPSDDGSEATREEPVPTSV